MRQELTKYVDALFAGRSGAEDMHQEILQNILDRYDDLIAKGKSSEAAYQLAIDGIGDLSEILPAATVSPAPMPKKRNGRRRFTQALWGFSTLGIYLALSFLTHAWYITWMVFLIMGCLRGIARSIRDLKGGNHHET